MALTVKRVVLWRREVENKPGMLAATLDRWPVLVPTYKW